MPNSTLGLRVLVLTAWLHYWVGMSVRNVVILMSLFSSTELQGLNPVEKVLCNIKDILGRAKKENISFKKAA